MLIIFDVLFSPRNLDKFTEAKIAADNFKFRGISAAIFVVVK